MDKNQTAATQRKKKQETETRVTFYIAIVSIGIALYVYIQSQPIILERTVLVTMVKNERKTLPRLLESVQPHLQHYSWVFVCDTGSTDGTLDYLARQNVKYVSHKWVDFATNRNLCLQTAKKWIESFTLVDMHHVLFLDADHVLKVTQAIDTYHDVNFVRIQEHDHPDGWTNQLPYYLSLNAIRYCRYKGVTHEYLDCGNATKHLSFNHHFNTFHVIHFGDGGTRLDKWERDKHLLITAFESKHTEPALKRRYAFYLGRTFEDLQDYTQAIHYYRMRARWGGWIEEAFFAQYRMTVCQLYLNTQTLGEIVEGFQLATQMLPYRPEPYFYLAQLAWEKEHDGPKCVWWCLQGIYAHSDAHQSLFLDDSIQTWKLQDQLGLCLYYSGAQDLGKHQWKTLLTSVKHAIPPKEQSRIQQNLLF